MSVKFIDKILDRLDISANAAARWMNVSPQQVHHARTKGETLSLHIMCLWRRISGLDWKEFGKLLDDEFITQSDEIILKANKPKKLK